MPRTTMTARLRSVMAVPLVVSLFTLTSLCYASPPDPSWITGLYDDGDHDEVVLEVAAVAAVPVATAPQTSAPGLVTRTPWLGRLAVPSPPSLRAPLDRSPPLA